MALADAIVWVESWDTATSLDSIYTSEGSGGSVAISTSGPRTGTHGLRITSADHRRCLVTLPAFAGGPVTVRLGFAYRATQGGIDTGVILLRHGATVHLAVRRINSTGALSLRLGGVAGSELAISAAAVAPIGEYMHLELVATIDDSSGYFEMRKNGDPSPILQFSGDTRNGGTAGVTIFAYGRNSSIGGGTTIDDFDDCWAMDGTHADADWVGDSFVRPRWPAAVGSDADFTPTAGANWENVDDASPDGDSTVNQSNTVGHRDLLTVGALDIPGRIITKQWQAVAKKNDAGARTFKGLSTLSGQEDETAEFSLGTGYQTFREMLPTAPGAVPWDEVTTLPQDGYEVAS